MSQHTHDYERALKSAQNQKDLYSAIVNAPYADRIFTTHLGLGIVVLLLKNDQTQTLDRIALSDTELATGAVRMSAKPFHEIKIPLDASQNILVQTVNHNKPMRTDDWQYLFTPVLTAQEARLNQYGAGVEFSFTYPLYSAAKKDTVGAMIFSYFSLHEEDMTAQEAFMESTSTLAAKYL